MEIIRAKDATRLVNLALSEIKNKSFKFHQTECEVLGGKVSSSTFLNQEQNYYLANINNIIKKQHHNAQLKSYDTTNLD